MKLAWSHGGDAEVLSFAENAVSLVSTIPSPPGSRIEGTVETDPPVRIKVKVHSSRKLPDGRYAIEGRPVDLTREVRERIVALLGK